MIKIVFCLLISFCNISNADMFTVGQLRDLIQQGEAGETIAVSYVQGVVDGMIGLDSALHIEKGIPYDFCKFHESFKQGKPEKHPAFKTKWLVSGWEKQGFPMNKPAIDMVINYLDANYGCKKTDKRY